MYNQDPKKRRKQDRLRFFGYGAMTIVTVLLAIVSVYFVLGYRLNNSLQVQQGGLVKFDSRPQAATVIFDGVKTGQTQSQLNSVVGQHTVAYNREGYESWQKTVNLHAGEVLWLEYPRLIPSLITTTSVAGVANVQQAMTAADRQSMLLHETPDAPIFTLVNASNEVKPVETTLALPQAAYTEPQADKPSTFEIAMLSRDGDFALIKHTYNDNAIEYIRMPIAQPDRAENLTTLFGKPLTGLRFAEGSNTIFIGIDANATLYRLDYGAADKPTTIATKVVAFDELNESTVTYAIKPTEKDTSRSIYVWQKGDKRTKVGAVNSDDPLQLYYNEYYGHTYITQVLGGSLSIIEDPLNSSKTQTSQMSLSFTPSAVKASPGNRFIMLQHGESIAVYDIELAQLYTFTSPGETRPSLQWADDHRLALTGNGSLRLVEFDGTNGHAITSIATSQDVLIGTQGRVILSIGKDATGQNLQLQSSSLLTPADQ